MDLETAVREMLILYYNENQKQKPKVSHCCGDFMTCLGMLPGAGAML